MRLIQFPQATTLTTLTTLTAALAAAAIALSTPTAAAQVAPAAQVKVGLGGYCPVCLLEARKWERGKQEFSSTYDNTTYYFPNATIKGKFDAMPAKYVPALGGDCIVCYAKAGKRVAGSIQHGTIHNNRLFLFPSAGELKAFQANPKQFADADLAANGECVVCRAKANKRVPGSAKFTVIHNGFRYQFPSAREADEFRRSPAMYVTAVMKSSEAIAMKKAPAAQLVSIAGRTACAGCEHGVTPLGSPNELGLAVNTKDGQVIVVEDAHKLYPQSYAARFRGQNVRVNGNIIKKQGKISWLKPTSLEVLN